MTGVPPVRVLVHRSAARVIRTELTRLANLEGLARDLFEKVSKALAQ